MYPEKKGGSHEMARPQQNWGLLTLLTRWASIWTMPNTASPKSEPPCGRAVYPPCEGRPRVLDQETGSHSSDSINKKACQTTQHHSEISLGAKLIMAQLHNKASEILVNKDSGNGFLHDGTKPLPETMWAYHQIDQ